MSDLTSKLAEAVNCGAITLEDAAALLNNNSDKLWDMLVASKATVTIPLAELVKLEASAPTQPTGPEFEINLSEEDPGPDMCIAWVQYLINYRHQQSTGGKGLSAHVWRFAVSSAFANHPLPGADGKWFQATIESGLERLDDSSPYPNAANLHQTRLIHGMVIKADLDKALGIMRAYYAYHSEDNGIGPLMMAVGTVVEDAVMALANDDNNGILVVLSAIRNMCDVYKSAALATGIPAVVPRGPVTGTGTGASLPERRNKQAKEDTARNELWDKLEASGATVYLTDNAEWIGRDIMCTGCGHLNKIEDVIRRSGLESCCCTSCDTVIIIATRTDIEKLRGALGVTPAAPGSEAESDQVARDLVERAKRQREA